MAWTNTGLLKEIAKRLWQRKVRTVLSLISVAVATLALVVMAALGEWLQSQVALQVEEVASRIAVSPKPGGDPISKSTLNRIGRISEVTGVRVTLSGLMDEEAEDRYTPSLLGPAIFYAVFSDALRTPWSPVLPVALAQGRWPEAVERTSAVVGYELAKQQGLQIGAELDIQGRRFTVVGIWPRMPQEPANFAQIHYETARDVLGRDAGMGQVEVLPAPGADVEALATRLQAEVPGILARSPSVAVAETRASLLFYSLILAGSVTLSMLIAGVTITNTLLTSVVERRRELGLKKALGANNRDLTVDVLLEAGMIGALGGSLGLLVGLAIAVSLNSITGVTQGTQMLLLTPRVVLLGWGFGPLVALLAGIYPTWQVCRLDPIPALRNLPSAVPCDHGLRRLVYLVRRRPQYFLTVSGVAAGVFAVVILGSLVELVNLTIAEATAGGKTRVVALFPRHEGQWITRKDVHIVAGIPGVEEVVLAAKGGPLSEDTSTSEHLIGIDSEAGRMGFETPFELELMAGRFLDRNRSNEALVAYDVAQQHGWTVGDIVRIRDREFTVVGIFSRTPAGNLIGNLGNRVYVSLRALDRLGEDTPQSQTLTAFVAPDADPNAVAQQLKQRLSHLDVMTGREQVDIMRVLLFVIMAVPVLGTAMALLIGGLSITNTMIMAVVERTREVGLKKALGARDGDMLREVLLDAVWVCVAGGALGLACATALAAGLNKVLTMRSGVVLLLVTPRLVLVAMVLAVVLGAIASLYPARWASRLDPVIALRSE